MELGLDYFRTLFNMQELAVEEHCNRSNVGCGTALDWQRCTGPDEEGTYCRRVFVLLGYNKDKLQ